MVFNIIIWVLLIVLVAFHAVWFYNYNEYKPFMKVVNKDEWRRYSCTDEKMITYSVFPPTYPSFVDNLFISDFQNDDLAAGDVLVDMLSWPEGDKYTVGISLQFAKESKINGNQDNGMLSLTTESINFELDENGNLLRYYDEKYTNIFNENYRLM